ncbi:MAG TPA: TIGR02300 family protein [Nitrospiraceae bacterium]|nr:TIGR02300 family protein [Nitrospiraceae bacterium]
MKVLSFEANRSARGKKHACAVCEARFYDLNRSPIVCPACSSPFAPPEPLQAKLAGNTRNRWRDHTPKPKYVPPEMNAEEISGPIAGEAEAVGDDSAPAVPDDSVPEEIQEDGDVSGLLDVDKSRDE